MIPERPAGSTASPSLEVSCLPVADPIQKHRDMAPWQLCSRLLRNCVRPGIGESPHMPEVAGRPAAHLGISGTPTGFGSEKRKCRVGLAEIDVNRQAEGQVCGK